MSDLAARANHVSTRQDLQLLLEQLARNALTEKAEWANLTVEEFLSAAAAWLDDMDGYFKNRGEAVPQVPSWNLFAQMLMAARVYEQSVS